MSSSSLSVLSTALNEVDSEGKISEETASINKEFAPLYAPSKIDVSLYFTTALLKSASSLVLIEVMPMATKELT